VEVFYRRERVDKLVEDLGNGLVVEVNDLVTHNVNARLVLTDAIDRIEDPDTVVRLWESVTSLSVLDPTVGSGAFLFAAMEALEDIYHHIIDMLKSGVSSSPAAESIITEIDRHPNDRYFVRKSIALNNLYGTDLMPDAIETAQLRIFLSLVSCLESRSELEPLPDLDFNLKCGNLLVGFRDPDDLDRFGGDLLNELVLQDLRPEIEKYKSLYREFVVQSTSGDSPHLLELKRSLDAVSDALRTQTNEAFTEIDDVVSERREEWVAQYRPFHWFIEFPEVIDRGGFDVVVGNPPYIAGSDLSVEEKRQLTTYSTAKCPNLYAICFERSLDLVNAHTGRHSFIVMHNIAFSAGFEALRLKISELEGAEWWASFGNFPSGLFSVAAVRNSIVVLAPGRIVSSTRHHIFTTQTRTHLFSSLEYQEVKRERSEPPPRGGLAAGLENRLRSMEEPYSDKLGGVIALKPTATYWFPVMPEIPPTFSPSGEILDGVESTVKVVSIGSNEDKRIVVAALGGKVGYFWWSATGDNFHVGQGETYAPRAMLLDIPRTHNPLKALADRLFEELPQAVILNYHLGVRANIRWSDLRELTDLFDREFLASSGLLSEWKNLNIWYRQSMRSSGPSRKDRPIDEGVATRIVLG
jgi:hypothetical protein